MSRTLRCQQCREVLGTVHGEALRPTVGARLLVDLAARRASITCPACGTVRDWREGCVLIERSRVLDSTITDGAASGRRSER